MEAKCKTCEVFFPTAEILVTMDGIYCEKCVPDEAKTLLFSFQFSWKGINALTKYIDGDTDLEVLEIVETMRKAMDKKIMEQIRRLIDGEIRQSDS